MSHGYYTTTAVKGRNEEREATVPMVGKRKLTDTVTYEWHLRELHAVEDECSRKVGQADAMKRDLARLTAERDRQWREIQDLRKQVEQAPATAPAIPQPLWRKLASLCHPDKHDGSQVAHEVMTWLNSVRSRA